MPAAIVVHLDSGIHLELRIIVAAGALAAWAGSGLQPLESRQAQAPMQHGSTALLRDRGFLAIIAASALIQGSHSTYYVFGSITW